jgi:hypothetical protein
LALASAKPELLTCKTCHKTVFEKVEAGQFLLNQEWLDQGLPLAKLIIDRYSLGGGVIYRCMGCGRLANEPRT